MVLKRVIFFCRLIVYKYRRLFRTPSRGLLKERMNKILDCRDSKTPKILSRRHKHPERVARVDFIVIWRFAKKKVTVSVAKMQYAKFWELSSGSSLWLEEKRRFVGQNITDFYKIWTSYFIMYFLQSSKKTRYKSTLFIFVLCNGSFCLVPVLSQPKQIQVKKV